MSESQEIRPVRQLSFLQSFVVSLVRVIIGWHLLYQGVIKYQNKDWTAEGFLANSNWVLAPWFHELAADADRLHVVNELNVYGLMVIGLALICGVMPRVASFFGTLLLLSYYLAYSPMHGLGYAGGPGNDFGVNTILIEAAVLLVLTVLPSGSLLRLDRALAVILGGKVRPPGPVEEETFDETAYGRRQVIGGLASLPLVGLFFGGLYRKQKSGNAASDAISGATIKPPEVDLTKLKGQAPCAKIGNLTISRIFLGSNLIGGWAHSRDLIYGPSLFKAYNTKYKVMETLKLAEQTGVNMINIVVDGQLALINQYNDLYNGKMQTMCQIRQVKEADGEPRPLKREIDLAIDQGATTFYIQGAVGDRFAQQGRIGELAELIEYARGQGYVVGMGAHSIKVIEACEQEGVPSDYYVKTFHHDNYWSATPKDKREEFSVDRERFVDHDKFHDNIYDLFPERTKEVMAQVQKPFVAFKVLAAGAIHPADGFKWAFSNGADFICVGMFDFQIVDDVNIALDVLNQAEVRNRPRPWLA